MNCYFSVENERYLSHLRRLIEKFQHALRKEDLPSIHPSLVSGRKLDPAIAVLLQPIYEQALLSAGDGDADPVRALLDFKKGLAQVHLAEAERLKKEVASVKR